MKRKIRYGVFETNSSQCHAISVARVKDSRLTIPETLVFSADCFESSSYPLSPTKNKPEEYVDTQDKANFLYSALREKYMESNPRLYKHFLKFIEKALNEVGVKNVIFEDTKSDYDPKKDFIGYTGVVFSDKFFSDLIYNPRRLRSFLFSKKSVIDSARDEYCEVSPRKNTDEVSYGWKWYASY